MEWQLIAITVSKSIFSVSIKCVGIKTTTLMKVLLFCAMFMKLVHSWSTHISSSCSQIGRNALNQLTLLFTVHIYI